MSEHIRIAVHNGAGFITLDRPKALNSLSLDMIRAIAAALSDWRDDPAIRAVVLRSSGDKAFCAGGDIRFFHAVGHATPAGGSALLEDFFSEEYAMNHLAHTYPKPCIVLLDGIVMGGGMGIAQCNPAHRLRVVTERTRMAMPEVNIGLFPDVGGSYFLSRAPGCIGAYLAVTGETMTAADALYAGFAELAVPAARLPELNELLESAGWTDARDAVRQFASRLPEQIDLGSGMLAEQRAAIDRHYSFDSVPAIVGSLQQDDSEFAQKSLAAMRQRSPLMMCVALEQVRRGAGMNMADCLRMERSMMRRNFEHGDALEGIRARVIDKDNLPRWTPASLEGVEQAMIDRFFSPVWPDRAHPLRDLQ